MKMRALFITVVVLSWLIALNYNSYCSMTFCSKVVAKDNNSKSETMKLLTFLPWDVNTYNDFGIFTIFHSGKLPLVEACYAGDKDIVVSLLNKGADPNKTHDGYWHAVTATVLSYGDFGNRMEILDTLFNAGADISHLTGNSAPLKLIWYSEDKETQRLSMKIISKLLQHNASLANTNITYQMAFSGNVDGIRFLVDKYKVDINSSKYGIHPLIGAVRGSSYEEAEYLLSIGANMNVQYENKTPIEWATYLDDEKMVKILTAYQPTI